MSTEAAVQVQPQKTPVTNGTPTKAGSPAKSNSVVNGGTTLNSSAVMASVTGQITRERSFIRQQHPHQSQQSHHLASVNQKRRSLGQYNNYHHHQTSPQQMRGKPELEIYRPPNVRVDGIQQTASTAVTPGAANNMGSNHVNSAGNKLNVHAQEFTMNINPSSAALLFQPSGHFLQLSKSSGNVQQHFGLATSAPGRGHHLALSNFGPPHHQRALLMTKGANGKVSGNMKNAGLVALPSSQMPLVTSPSSGNILHTGLRVKFALDTPTTGHGQGVAGGIAVAPGQPPNGPLINPLQRSKSLSSADAFCRGGAGMGFALGGDAKDIGVFAPEIQSLLDKAADDPNALSARHLMELASVVLQRAVEARRYALPVSRLCITIIAKERKETFLEALLNICRQWYQEREKVLGPLPNSKNPSRPRFTAFMAFLTEMFCQLKRRQLQLRTQCDGVPPPLVLLTVLLKCCEDCVRPPVRSLSEIECLFFVLTCIGRDLESHLAEQLDGLLASVRDAFLNSNASAPAIRRTLLQLIELQASHWQLPGNTVLYYYPSSK